MLNTKHLSTITILSQHGWTSKHFFNLEEAYATIERYHKNKNDIAFHPHPQVSLHEVFPAARDIVESLNGIRIENLHPQLGLGSNCCVIEFDFFEYDSSNLHELQAMKEQLGKSILFIGIGYDFIGDWLVDEDGRIYFRNQITQQLFLVSNNIYSFLEKDIYKRTDLNGTYFLESDDKEITTLK